MKKTSTFYAVIIFLFFPLISLTNGNVTKTPEKVTQEQIDNIRQYNNKVLDTILYEASKY